MQGRGTIHTGAPTRGVYTHVHVHAQLTHPSTYTLLSTHIQVTHYTRSHMPSSSTSVCRWAHANAQASYMHRCVHASLHTCGRSRLCTLMLPSFHTLVNRLVPVDTHTHTHTHTHTEAVHNSSCKCAGTKMKDANSTGLHVSGWGGAQDSLHLLPCGWTRPSPRPPQETFNSGQ